MPPIVLQSASAYHCMSAAVFARTCIAVYGSLNDPWHFTSDGSNVTGIQCMHICVDLLASGLHIFIKHYFVLCSDNGCFSRKHSGGE